MIQAKRHCPTEKARHMSFHCFVPIGVVACVRCVYSWTTLVRIVAILFFIKICPEETMSLAYMIVATETLM